MVSALDKSIGKIFEALHEAGMLNNTFLSFSSDNGAAATFWGTYGASSYPLRGEKSTLWEGGVRVPGFVWTAEPLWLGRGSQYDRIFHATDWLPTLYEMAGGDPSKLGGIDGVSHLRSITDPLTNLPRSEILNIRGFSPNCGEGGGVYSTSVNCGKQNSSKASCDSTVTPCLYDIERDPCEYNDIAFENPERASNDVTKGATNLAASTTVTKDGDANTDPKAPLPLTPPGMSPAV
ncbi:hypothetical protein HPB51_000373 [Rhipicephalus microplus]|uniref:Sulfatase N-terminal domain-containing protein n=1 Tax=Rhipicephalus microplus TaxID=6941 RepID=A0A9J6D3P2_RHIMP|nr:hypothetical protein HPB51_000373 [Rhipicephalus microplus]